MVKTGAVVVFQGDSITDGGRSRDDDLNHVMGHGYAYMVCGRLSADFPGLGLKFFNRGISGNRIVDLYARWREDTINLQPTLVSILVGINDVSAEIIRSAGVSTAHYERTYRILLDDTLAWLRDVRIVVCEPFFLPHARRDPDNDRYAHEIAERAGVASTIAAQYGATFVPLQRMFEEAALRAPAEYWLWDGVHPTPQGHELIARRWVASVIADEES